MPIIEWNNSYLLGLKQFDEDHQHLVRLLNKTYDSFIHNEPKSNLIMLIDDLIDYAIYHFADEEYWMKETCYPGLEMQIFQHDIFSKKVVCFQDNYHKGAAVLSSELLKFMKDWLSDHILATDKEFGYFIASNGGLELISKAIGERGDSERC
jgi:hemerythrin